MAIDVMIALAGEQPMPNFIPIIQHQPGRVEFIVSDKTAPFAQSTIDTMRLDDRTKNVQTHINPQIDGYDLAAVESRCAEVIMRHPSKDIMVNLTGGTKVMCLAAYRTALTHQLPMLYVATDRELVLHYDGQGKEVDRQPLAAPIPISVHFAAYGIRAASRSSWDKPFTELARFLALHAVGASRIIDEARRSISQKGEAKVVEKPSPEEVEVAHRLYDEHLLALNPGSGDALVIRVADNPPIRSFLGGKWLELWVYEAAKESSFLDDAVFDVEIKKANGQALVMNQLDVVVTHNARMAICSCKTEANELTTKEENKGIIYELDSISRREQTGIYCKKILVTHLRRDNLPVAFLSRAQNSNIAVITGEQLPEVIEHLKQVFI